MICQLHKDGLQTALLTDKAIYQDASIDQLLKEHRLIGAISGKADSDILFPHGNSLDTGMAEQDRHGLLHIAVYGNYQRI